MNNGGMNDREAVAVAGSTTEDMPVDVSEALVSDILKGKTVKEDILGLIGYVWAEGNQKRVFPSTYMIDLVNYLMKKHGLGETDE